MGKCLPQKRFNEIQMQPDFSDPQLLPPSWTAAVVSLHTRAMRSISFLLVEAQLQGLPLPSEKKVQTLKNQFVWTTCIPQINNLFNSHIAQCARLKPGWINQRKCCQSKLIKNRCLVFKFLPNLVSKLIDHSCWIIFLDAAEWQLGRTHQTQWVVVLFAKHKLAQLSVLCALHQRASHSGWENKKQAL